MAYVFRAGYVSENAEVQRLRLRLWCSWKCEIPSCKIETCLESADAKRRSLSGLLPFVGYVLWGGAALMVALPHIDILDKLASLVNIHLLINMANVSIHGMGRYHQLVCNVRCGVPSGDKLKYFTFALR